MNMVLSCHSWYLLDLYVTLGIASGMRLCRDNEQPDNFNMIQANLTLATGNMLSLITYSTKRTQWMSLALHCNRKKEFKNSILLAAQYNQDNQACVR